MKITKSNSGFTLVEMIFVIVLFAILLGIVIVTYPQLLKNMKVRSDKASATHIAKALRGWYEDNMTDPNNKKEFKDFVSENLLNKTVKLSTLEEKGVGVYIDPGFKPFSLLDENKHIVEDQGFYVGIIGEGINARLVISVETETDRLSTIEGITSASYDGDSIGVICIEK